MNLTMNVTRKVSLKLDFDESVKKEEYNSHTKRSTPAYSQSHKKDSVHQPKITS